MLNVTKSFPIICILTNTIIINELGIHKTMSIYRATLAPDNEPATNSSQRIAVEDERLTDLDTNRRITDSEATEYAIALIVLHGGLINDLCYSVLR